MNPPDQELRESAQRMADAVNLHVVVGVDQARDTPGWVAIRMEDGGSDGVLYDTKPEAMRAHRHTNRTFYLAVGRDSMGLREAVVVLAQRRHAYRAGVRFDQDDTITPQLTELLRPFIPNTLKGLPRP